jgi:hypothetical protein
MVDADRDWHPIQVLKFIRAAAAATVAALVLLVTIRAQSPPAQTAPPRIALLVDTSEGVKASLTYLRAGLQSFVDALPPEPELLVATTGRRTAVRVQPTTDRKKARDFVGGLVDDAGGGPTPLMDSILEVDERFMRKATDRTPVFVIVTGDGTESSIRTSPDAFNQWLGTLHGRNVSVHALVIKSGNGMPEVVARAAAQTTSGLFQTITPGSPIAEAMQKVASRISEAMHR